MSSKYLELIKNTRPVFTGKLNPPTILLATPNRKGVSFIGAFNSLNISFRFNSMSEIDFVIPAEYSIRGVRTKNECYEMVRKDMLLHIVGMGWFVIIDAPISGEGIKEEKNVKAYSYEYTLSNIGSGSIGSAQTETKRTYLAISPALPSESAENISPQNSTDSSFGQTLIGYIGDIIELWKFGYINAKFQDKKTGKKIVRAILGDVSKNLYDFLMNDVEKAFGCYFVFDTEKQLIHILAEDDFENEETAILFSHDNLMKDKSITDEDKKIITALSITGENGITTAEVNPAGGAVIYNFSYYYPWMSSELQAALVSWENDIAEANKETSISTIYSYKFHHKRLTKTIMDLYALLDKNNSYLSSFRLKFAEWLERLNAEAISSTTSTAYKQCLSAVESYAKAVAIFSDGINDIYQNPSGTPIVKYHSETDKRYRMAVPGYYLTTYGNVYKINQAIEKLCGTNDGAIVNLPLELYTFQNEPLHLSPSTGLYELTTPQWGMYLQVTYIGQPRYFESYVNSTPPLNDYVGVYHTSPYFDTVTLGDYNKKFGLKNYLDKKNTALYQELFPFIHSDNYENTDYAVYDKMLTSKIIEVKDALFEEGVGELELRSQPTISFDMNIFNPLALRDFAPYAQNIYIGCQAKAEVQKGVWTKIRLIEINIDYDNPQELKVVCGNNRRLNTTEFTFREFFCNDATKKNSLLNDPIKVNYQSLSKSFAWY